MKGFTTAVAFLTRIPAGRHAGGDPELGRAVAWFPLVGAAVGLVAGGAYALAFRFLPSLLAAIVAVAVGLLITGGLHEDGLADTADAFGSGASGDEALQIMRDPRVGTYGAISLVLSVLWRVAALASLGSTLGAVGLVASHSLGRAGSVALMALAPAARSQGLASSVASVTDSRAATSAVAIGIGIGALLLGIWLAPAVLLVTAAVAWARFSAVRKVGGITGDVLGACEQLGEMGILALVAAISWRGGTIWWF